MRSVTEQERKAWASGSKKNLTLQFFDEFGNLATLTNDHIVSESMSIEQSICKNGDLIFGQCNAACFKVRVIAQGETRYKGSWFTATLSVDDPETAGVTYQRTLGTYKVDSDKATSDRLYRDIVAYDVLKDILPTDYNEWHNSMPLPMSLKQYRDAFFQHIGITQHALTPRYKYKAITGTTEDSFLQISSGNYTQLAEFPDYGVVLRESNRQGTVYKVEDIDIPEEQAQLFDLVVLFADSNGILNADNPYRFRSSSEADIPDADITDIYVCGSLSTLPSNFSRPDWKLNVTNATIEYAELCNDNMIIERNFVADGFSGSEILRCLCEVNGVCGYINFDNEFVFVEFSRSPDTLYPQTTLYPDASLYPRDWTTRRLNGIAVNSESYVMGTLVYEDYWCQNISQVQLRATHDDVGGIAGVEGNTYIIQNNPLLWGKDTAELRRIGNQFLKAVTFLYYRPSEVQCMGAPWQELGDSVGIYSPDGQDIILFIFNRMLKGITALRDKYSASGSEFYSEKANSTNYTMTAVKYKTNELIRTVDETTSTVARLEQDTMGDQDTSLKSQIQQTANSISLKVDKHIVDEHGHVIQEGGVSSSLSMESGQITIGTGRLIVDADNFSLTADGTMTAIDGHFGGTIKTGDFSPGGESSSATGFEVDTYGRAKLGSISFMYDDYGGRSVVSAEPDYGGRVRFYRGIECGGENNQARSRIAGLVVTGYNSENYPDLEVNSGNPGMDNNTEGFICATDSRFKGRIIINNVAVDTDPELRTSYSVVSLGPVWIQGREWPGYGLYVTGQTKFVGNVYNSSGNVQFVSDRNIKRDICSLSEKECLDFIYGLNPVQFVYKSDENDRITHGFIAQEVQEIEPWEIVGSDGDTLTIRYLEMLPDMVKVIQSQHKEIEELKARLDRLEGKVDG